MKNYLLAAWCLLCSFQAAISQAQNPSNPCAADYWRAIQLQDPALFQQNEAFEQQVLQVFQQKNSSTTPTENVLTIPVVVHIVHDNGVENLSDAQVQQAITWLNQALANQGNFNQGSGANTGIQLCLAQRTPDNLPTNGITRDQSPLTVMQMETQDQQVKNLNRWKPKDYVNIWVVRSICSNIYGCNVYGYANYPFAHGSNTDGIVMESAYLAELGKIAGLAHEVGHYLGLYHTFEGGCSNNNCLVNGDRICDTPPDQSTASVPCGEFFSSCSTDTQSGPFTTDQPDMSWNFMDYGILACFHDYTADQSTRMNATLEGIRKSLLESKGCLPPCPAPTVAAFTASATTVAAGETVFFNNNSQNALSYTWTLNGVPFGNQPNAGYTFTTPGVYTVVLSAQPLNSSLCDVNTTQITIEVYCAVTASFTLSELTPDQDETLFLSNTSQNATQIEWFVDGVSQGSVLDSIVFNAVGPYEIMLVVGNGICADTATESIYVLGVCTQKTFEYLIRIPEYINNFSQLNTTVAMLNEGNLVVLSTGYGGVMTDSKPILIKIKPNGEVIWTKNIGMGPATIIGSSAIKATPDGGFVVFLLDIGQIVPNIQTKYLAKFSSDGVMTWCQQMPHEFGSSAIDLLVYPDGSILVSDFFSILAKFTANGSLIWSKSYVGMEQLCSYPDGGFVALAAPFLMRFDAMGNMLWRRLLDSSPVMNLKTILAMPDGSIFLGGELPTNFPPAVHGRLLKLDANGETIWSKTYRQIPISTYQFECMAISPSGNLVIAGFARADGPGLGDFYPFHLLMELDLDGNILWSRHRPDDFHNQDLINLPGGGYVMTESNALTVRILKTDALGRTPGCPENPKVIDAYPLVVSNTAVNFGPLDDTALNIIPVVFPVEDTPWLIDTLCAPECQQSFEICNNNLDDDGDGLFDCLDAECDCEEDKCQPKQGNIWYFGYNTGLDFSETPPKVLVNGQTNCINTSATMCDVEGNLLLYTDGVKVFNRFHQPMPNGELQISLTANQCIILPHPGNPSQYYVVVNYMGGLIYTSLVDMTLDEGRGDLLPLQKNFPLASLSSGLAAVKACSFKGFWLITRTLEMESRFLSFRLDPTGLLLNPFSSNTGQPVGSVGQIKFSSDGQYLASTYISINNFDSSFVSIYRFDPYTSGLVFNPSVLGAYKLPFGTYGVEFSPNGRFLYVSGEFQGAGRLLQFDLEAGDLAAIKNSQVQLAEFSNKNIRFLQLAPNGKIYAPSDPFNFTSPFNHKLDVIHKPDLPGLDCQYQHEGLVISNPPSSVGVVFGLSNVIASYFEKPQKPIFVPNAPDTICELNVPIQYQLMAVQCEVDSIAWQVDGLNAQIQPNFQSASIRYLTPGSGRLIVTTFSACGTASDTLEILVVEPLNQTLDLGPDLLVCQNGVFSFNAGSGFARYQWSDGTADSTVTTLFTGKYWVNVWDACGNKQSDTITVSIAPNSVLDLGADLPQQCPGYSVAYQQPASFVNWQWSPNDFLSCADCPNVTLSPQASTTWVIIGQTAEGCISVDTLSATIRDTLLFSRDTAVCIGQTLEVLGTQLPADTTAQFFLPAAAIGCDTLLTIHVLGIETASTQIDTIICPNTFFDFNGTQLSADTVAVFHFASLAACDSVVTVRVDAYPPLSLALPMDTTIRVGASVLLEAEVDGTGALDFDWSPTEGLSCTDCPNPLANPLDTITYTLAVTDLNGCSVQESVTLRVNEECRVRIPTAFTPNGDGSNDVFRPVLDPCVRTVRLWQILNRWGEVVLTQLNFPANDPNLGWDGIWDGKAHPSDVLIWVAEFEFYDGRKESQKGEVTLVR